MAKTLVAVGQRYGRLVVQSFSHSNGQKYWKCLCDCGQQRVVPTHSLRSGNTTSCGCVRLEIIARRFRTHGLSRRPEYTHWKAMRKRCTNPNDIVYPRYGGAGIVVCPEWMESFEAFLRDMGPAPSDKHTIDRINSRGNYEPSNCRWADPVLQGRNKRSTKWLTFNGETLCIKDWSKRLHISRITISRRLAAGMPLDLVLKVNPAKGRKRQKGNGILDQWLASKSA